MPKVEEHAVHTFCWNQLATTNVDSAAVFYTALFDCDLDDSDVGADSEMVRLALRGRHVMGIHRMSDTEIDGGHSAYWEAYATVDDLEGLLERVESNGGTIIDEPADLGDFGRFAQIQDPDGAKLCLWVPRGFHGRGWIDEFDAPVWHELHCVRDEEMQQFYAAVFGWSIATRGEGHAQSFHCSAGDKSICSIRAIPAEEPDPNQLGPSTTLAHWLVYFAVQDLDATVAAAQTLGARIHLEAMDLPDGNRHAILVDPHGARFGVIQLLHF